jgi:hypothetical protein
VNSQKKKVTMESKRDCRQCQLVSGSVLSFVGARQLFGKHHAYPALNRLSGVALLAGGFYAIFIMPFRTVSLLLALNFNSHFSGRSLVPSHDPIISLTS